MNSESSLTLFIITALSVDANPNAWEAFSLSNVIVPIGTRYLAFPMVRRHTA